MGGFDAERKRSRGIGLDMKKAFDNAAGSSARRAGRRANIGLDMKKAFDAAAGAAARDEAIDRVEVSAGEVWQASALVILKRVAIKQFEFTTDDLRLAGVADPPSDPRAFGALMRAAAHLRLVTPTDRTRCTERVTAHRRPQRVWRSLVYRG